LNSVGIRSFSELTASHIKDFNAQDVHKTPAGKNAYNVRIRKFLFYLGDEGYLNNPMLFVALNRTSAPKETIVVVLSETEMEQLNTELTSEESVLSLRKKAMLLLGLKMGMRSSDIVNLQFDDINWQTASIRFIQSKTSVEVNLPMPTEVGNTLFRYITEERNRKADPNIFLGEKAPHRVVGRAVCRKALKTALPDRNVEGSGFHVTRKTYATNLLRKGVGADKVANALGQQGTASVHRYLSLDVDRMRMCALSLRDCRIGGWHDER
jgi:integrase